jgi:glutamine synthetase
VRNYRRSTTTLKKNNNNKMRNVQEIMNKGLITPEELKLLAGKGLIETVIVCSTDHIGKLIGKRYDVDFFFEEGIHGSRICEYLLTVDMDANILPGFKFANWNTGYGDFDLVPDISTLRIASWLDKTALVICDLRHPKSRELIPVGPRSILIKQIERAKKMGFKAIGASELEYFMYKTSYEDAAKNDHSEKHLENWGWFLEDCALLAGSRTEILNAQIRRHLKRSGIPVENSK